ncbi:MAG: IS605 OrfB-like transposable element containing RNAse H-like and Zn finger domain [Candidatus Methanohalarchaeum thermophilum]|uniref:IS605 OrfB-like transposable element containing RNAse H-like and Zn finger domain n=1 Tax=Methanohalarchaeum thermophilum TaxID=1903181 RepID=A0A1Q6DX61_METT1|nr:MAG: IS605 OrfB-like transposable element containing RNAse H-like and Zn finger domain [Candidatus Methanohalarchaeum thermophilum]
MKHVDKAFKSFFNLIKKKREGKYDAEAHPPRYLDKDGYFSLIYPNQSFQVKEDHIRVGVPKGFREKYGYDKREIRIDFTYEKLKQSHIDIKQLHIIPGAKAQYFEYRVVYEEEKEPVEAKGGCLVRY